MPTINIVLPSGEIVTGISNSHTEEQLKSAILNRQQIAANYCTDKGWPTDPAQLSFEQILEIRATKEWIDAGK